MDGKTILVVDDSEDVRNLAEKQLRASIRGAKIVCAVGVTDAMTVLSNSEVHFVVSDFNMPDGNGHDIARFIFEAGLEIPVLIMSGHVPDQREPTLVRKYIEKPFTTHELVRAIRAVMGSTKKS